MKSRMVLRGQPASQNAFAMLQLFSLRICSTLWYLVWILARLWVLARVASFCWGCCWASSAECWHRVLSSALSSAIVLLASTNLVCRVLMASDFVCTRLANSSASFSCSSNSAASSWFCGCWFWKDWPTLSWSFFRLLIALGGLPLLFLRWLSWTRTLPVITRTDTTLVDTMKNRVVAAADSTFQKSLRHCFLFVNKYVMIVFLFTKASPLIGLIRRPKLSRIAQRIIHIWRTNIPKIRIALHYRAILNFTFRWRILTHFRLMHRECACAFKF